MTGGGGRDDKCSGIPGTWFVIPTLWWDLDHRGIRSLPLVEMTEEEVVEMTGKAVEMI